MSERGETGQDRISLLPDQLLGHILSVSDLRTKDSVRTSVLSKRWKSVWLSVPLLDLDIVEFPGYYEFVSFLERFLDFSKELCIYKFKLAFVRNKLDPAYMTQLIHNTIMRRVQHLDLLCYSSYLVETLMYLSVYTCETLVNLKLCSVTSLAEFEYVSLPRLKIMHLENSIYPNDALLEKLISSCPVLEDLQVVRNVAVDKTATVLRVRSQSLESLIFYRNGHTHGTYEVVIDAPGLKYLSLTDYQSRSFVISNLSSSAKVDIDVNFYYMVNSSAVSAFSKRSVVRKFLTGLSSVREMTISQTTLKVICDCLMKHEPLPQFAHMTLLHVNSCKYDLEKLPNFLESFPNLKSFVLDHTEYNNEQIMLSSSVPECLRSSLEFVVIKTPIWRADTETEMKLVKYFLENSAVLKKLTLRLGCRTMDEESILSMGLLKLRRCSASCEVIVEFEEISPTMIHRFL